MVPLNYPAVLVCAVAAMVLGFLWYGPIFGKAWARLMGWDSASMNAAKQRGMWKQYAIQAVGALLMAFVMGHAMVFAQTYLNESNLSAGLQGGFWNWLGFVAPVLVGSVLWEKKSWKLYFLNAGYYLVVLVVMGLILAYWK